MLFDRFIRGLLAGIIAGIAMDTIDLIGYWLKLDQARYLDFAAVIAFGKTASSWMETILSLIIELMFKGLLGVLFVFLIPKIKSKYLIIKAILFGTTTWFIIYSIIVLSKATKFPKVDAGVALSHLINSSVFGIVLTLTLYWIEKKTKQKAS